MRCAICTSKEGERHHIGCTYLEYMWPPAQDQVDPEYNSLEYMTDEEAYYWWLRCMNSPVYRRRRG